MLELPSVIVGSNLMYPALTCINGDFQQQSQSGSFWLDEGIGADIRVASNAVAHILFKSLQFERACGGDRGPRSGDGGLSASEIR